MRAHREGGGTDASRARRPGTRPLPRKKEKRRSPAPHIRHKWRARRFLRAVRGRGSRVLRRPDPRGRRRNGWAGARRSGRPTGGSQQAEAEHRRRTGQRDRQTRDVESPCPAVPPARRHPGRRHEVAGEEADHGGAALRLHGGDEGPGPGHGEHRGEEDRPRFGMETSPLAQERCARDKRGASGKEWKTVRPIIFTWLFCVWILHKNTPRTCSGRTKG